MTTNAPARTVKKRATQNPMPMAYLLMRATTISRLLADFKNLESESIPGRLAPCTRFFRVRLRKLTVSATTATITGSARLDNGGGNVTFTITAVDSSSDGSTDSFTISLSNGYSAGGTLTSGDVSIQ